MNDDRFELLAEKHLEGRLADDEARELAAALEADPALRRRLLREVSMAGLLASASRPAPDLVPKVQAALRDGADRDAMVGRVLGALPRPRPWRAALAAASLLAVVGLVLVIHAMVPAPAPVVRRRAGMGPEARAAVARAVDFLLKSQVPHGPWNGPVPADELVLLALHHGGVPSDAPRFRELLEKALSRRLDRTYTVALQAVLLAKLDPVRHRDRIAACARWLVENQARSGQWAYTTPDDASRAGAGAANNSCSLFAAMGLRAAASAGVGIPRETLVRARDAWRSSMRPDLDPQATGRAGWCYSREETDHHPYGSMTAGGLAALITVDRLLGEDWRRDPAVRAALSWLGFHFTVHENFGPVEDLMAREILSDTPSPATEYYYYLWALERAAALSESAAFGGRDWHAEGTQELLALQRRDGSWHAGVKRCNPVWDTCYAILFLTRSSGEAR